MRPIKSKPILRFLFFLSASASIAGCHGKTLPNVRNYMQTNKEARHGDSIVEQTGQEESQSPQPTGPTPTSPIDWDAGNEDEFQ